jgi:hypothetical protein
LARKGGAPDHCSTTEKIHQDGFVASEWLDKISCGGLSYPSVALSNDIKVMDGIFQELHWNSEDGLSRDKGIIAKLTSKLVHEFPQYPEKMLKKFAKARTIFRMRSIQQEVFRVQLKLRETARSKKKKIEYMY